MFLGLCVAACGSSAHAGFLSKFTGVADTGSGRMVQYTVWENTTGSSATVDGLTGSPTVAAGSFAYLYQVLAPAIPAVNSFRALIASQRVSTAGVVGGQSFVGADTFGADATLAATQLNAGSLTDFTIPGHVSSPVNHQSELMYILSAEQPEFGMIRLANGANQDATVAVLGAPVPVPLPASLVLFGLGLPLVRTLRRKLAK